MYRAVLAFSALAVSASLFLSCGMVLPGDSYNYYNPYDATGPGSIAGELDYIAPVLRWNDVSADSAAMSSCGALHLAAQFGIFVNGSDEATRSLWYSHPNEQFEFSGLLLPDRDDRYVIPFWFQQVPLTRYKAAWYTVESKGEGSPVIVTFIAPQTVELSKSLTEIADIHSTYKLCGDLEHGTTVKGKLCISGNGFVGQYWVDLRNDYVIQSPLGNPLQPTYWDMNIDHNTNGRIFFEIRNLAEGTYKIYEWRSIATQLGSGYWLHDQTNIYNEDVPYWTFTATKDHDIINSKAYVHLTATAPLNQPEPTVWSDIECGQVDVELTLSRQLDWSNDYQLLLSSLAPVGQYNDYAWNFLNPEHFDKHNVAHYRIGVVRHGSYILQLVQLGETNNDPATILAGYPGIIKVDRTHTEPIPDDFFNPWLPYAAVKWQVELP
jgi:hypothetical protein